MKTILNALLLLSLTGIFSSCNGQSNSTDVNSEQVKTSEVNVYYFHYTRRCATCNAVQSVSQEAIADLNNSKLIFTEYNLDTPEGKAKGDEVEVSGQTLLIVSGDKKIDITNDGFLYARNNPDQLKKIINENIKPFL